jgi:phosphoribulokinase
LQVLPTQLIPDEKEGKVLRVRFIQKEGVKFFDPVYLFDEGSTISWIPCGRKLTCSFPGIKCALDHCHSSTLFKESNAVTRH